MPTFETLVAFSFAAFLLSISPGPSNLYVMARSIHQGFIGGAAAAGGMAVGSFIYVILSALGLAAIFTYAPLAYTLLKVFGAIYLIYLGISYLRAPAIDTTMPEADSTTQTTKHPSLLKIFNQSIVVELTNPKTALFFLAFLPQFVSAEQGNVTLQFIVLGVIYAIIALLCDLFVAGMSGKLGGWLRNNPKFINYQDKISGSLLMGLGSYIGIQEVVK